MSHQEKMAEFDRECEKRQREREQQQAAAAARRRAEQQQQQQALTSGGIGGGGGGSSEGPAGTAAYGVGPGTPLVQRRGERQQPASTAAAAPPPVAPLGVGGAGGGSLRGSGGASSAPSSDSEDEEEQGGGGGGGGGGVPMEELIARSRLEEASLNLVMEAMWAANVVDIQATLSKVRRGARAAQARTAQAVLCFQERLCMNACCSEMY